MGERGPAKKPTLQVVREGNPGRRPIKEGVKAPLVDDLAEPDWLELFPAATKPRKPTRPRSGDPEDIIDWKLELGEYRLRCDAVDGAKRCRARAAAEWRRVVPILAKSAGLAEVDRAVVIDYCLTVARLTECERGISVGGLITAGQKGPVRNPLTTIAAQYRTQLKTYIGQLGLSPSARAGMDPPGDDDGDGDGAFD